MNNRNCLVCGQRHDNNVSLFCGDECENMRIMTDKQWEKVHEKTGTDILEMESYGDIYVVVTENDQPHKVMGKEFSDDTGPLVFEQPVRTSDLDSVRKRRDQLQARYGKCRIARLEFLKEEK